MPIFFLVYLAALLVSIYFMLDAFGPKFYEPKQGNVVGWKPKQLGEPDSVWFFKRIAKMRMDEQVNEWLDYFKTRNLSDIVEKATEDTFYEAGLIAKKVAEKVTSIKRSKNVFFASLVALALMVLAGVLSII